MVTSNPDYYAHESAWIDSGCRIGAGTKIWHATHVMSGATIGAGCSLGQNCFVAADATIGDRVKIQNNVSIYGGVEIDDDVFLGPSCVFTNVSNPRSQVDRKSLYERTRLARGATVGANATLCCGITVGRYAFVGAGAVVTKDVPDYALVTGVAASQVGWMSRHGHRLRANAEEAVLICPESGFRYQEADGQLRCLDLDEDARLPSEHQVGKGAYSSFKKG